MGRPVPRPPGWVAEVLFPRIIGLRAFKVGAIRCRLCSQYLFGLGLGLAGFALAAYAFARCYLGIVAST